MNAVLTQSDIRQLPTAKNASTLYAMTKSGIIEETESSSSCSKESEVWNSMSTPPTYGLTKNVDED